jgi:hypothetical protein
MISANGVAVPLSRCRIVHLPSFFASSFFHTSKIHHIIRWIRRTTTNAEELYSPLQADLCCIIADFLPKTSRALLAVALTAKSSSFREGWKGQPTNVSKAIISRTKAGGSFATVLDEICKEDRAEAEAKGKHRKLKMWIGNEEYDQIFRQCLSKQLKEYYNSQWEMVDFIDIPVSLASRLTDDDVAAILLCIDAKRKLKQLKLTHCTNVVGHGLEPRQFECPYLHQTSGGRGDDFLFDDAKLSEGPVCDIIDSILREEGDSFKRLQYPYKWSDKSSEPDNLVPIYDKNVLRSERMMQLFVDEHCAVVNKFACCLYFGFEDEKDFCGLIWDADLVDACIDCHTDTYAVCSNCNDIVCFECCETEECDVCNINYCPRCARDNGFENVVSWCEAAGFGSDCPSLFQLPSE